MSPTFSAGGWNQLSCLSLTRRAVCCPPLDAISTARFSSCFPIIFTGLNSSSSSPVPSCRFVPIPQAYTDPGIKTKKNISSIQATDKQSDRQKEPHRFSPSLVTAKLTDAPHVTLQAASIPETSVGSVFSSAPWPRPRRPYSALPRLYTCPKTQHPDVKVLTTTQSPNRAEECRKCPRYPVFRICPFLEVG